MFNIETIGIESTEAVNALLENYTDRYLEDTVRIAATKTALETDIPLVVEAMGVILSLYANKLVSGEITLNRVIH